MCLAGVSACPQPAEKAEHLKVSTEKIPESQVVMTIEVEPDRLDQARDRAVRKLSPRAKVPGFRPGKAPAALVRQYFGEERILDEALDLLVPDVYKEAVEAEGDLDPIARPRLVVETVEPLVVKATIPVRPTIELNDYTEVRVTPEEITVEESRVDDTILALRRRAATLEPAERGIEWRDVVRLDVEATVEGETLVNKQEAEIQLDEDRPVLFPGFEQQILGKTKGESFEFDLAVPETVTDERFKDKQAHFTVTILEVKTEVLPEVDADFLKAVGEGFESEQSLREKIRADIEKNEQDQLNNRYHDEILNDLVERATIEFPPVMLDAEVDRLFHDQAGHFDKQEELERYLQMVGKTAEQVREELRPVADTRLKRSLVLGRVAEVEDVQVSGEEVTAEIDTMTAAAGPQGAQLRQMFETENGRDTIHRNLMTRKTLARLVDIALQPQVKAAKKAKASKKKDEAATDAEPAGEPEPAPAESGE
jgi:trigger factor